MTKNKFFASEKPVHSVGNLSSPLWIVTDAPRAEDVIAGRPLVGRSGEMITNTLGRYGIDIDSSYITTISPFRPVGDNTFLIASSPEYQSGKARLLENIIKSKPKTILALGEESFTLLTGRLGIHTHRGSVYPCIVSPNTNVLSTYHPAYCSFNPVSYPAFDADISKLSRVIENKFSLPVYNFTHGKDVTNALVEEYKQSEYLAVDIESRRNSTQILCIGFAKDSRNAISITLDLNDPLVNRRWVEELLECSAKKIFHNGTFDVTMLELNNYKINNYTDDTIIAAHVLYLELPRDLGYLASIYTDINSYKEEGRSSIPSDTKSWNAKRTMKDLLVYNCTDCCVTYEVWEKLLPQMDDDDLRIYRYEMELVLATIKMGHLGLLRDESRRLEIEKALKMKVNKYETLLNLALGTEININSPKQVQYVLYEHFKLPQRTKKVKKKNSNENSIKSTSDNDAIVSLLTYCKNKYEELKLAKSKTPWELKLKFLSALLVLRETNKMLSSQVSIPASRDGRVKSIYKVAGTESGRLSAAKYLDGTGMNVQTITREAVEV